MRALERRLEAPENEIDELEHVEEVDVLIAIDVAEDRLIRVRHVTLEQDVDHLEHVEEVRDAAVDLTITQLAACAVEAELPGRARGQRRLAAGLVRVDLPVAAGGQGG